MGSPWPESRFTTTHQHHSHPLLLIIRLRTRLFISVYRYADVIFFVGSCLNMEKTKLNFPGEVVCLDTPDIYPPQRKVFLMWTHMWKHHTNNYDYFMKVDHDSYVNARRLRVLLTTAQTEAYMKQCSYIGMQATGRAQEQGRLGLSGRPYCSGLGYLLNTLCMEYVCFNPACSDLCCIAKQLLRSNVTSQTDVAPTSMCVNRCSANPFLMSTSLRNPGRWGQI